MRKLFLAVALLVGSVAACSDPVSQVCTSEYPQVRVSPRERTIAVGATYLASADALICSGTRSTAFTGVWSSSSGNVAAVDSATGLIRGISSGTAYVRAQFRFPGVPPITGTSDSLRITVP